MTDLKFQNDLIQACQASYDISKFPIPEGYTLLEATKVDPATGFAAIVLKKDDNIIIAYRGTDEEEFSYLGSLNTKHLPDIKNDLAMFVNRNLPQQSYEALSLYDKCAKKYKGYNITVTGHSLGGSCANIVGALRGVEAVGFNPYGVKDLLDKTMVKYEAKNIINYCNPNDIITTINGHNQIGTLYKMKTRGKGDKFCYDHRLENQQPITEQKEISKNDLDVKPGLVTEGKHIASTLNKYVEGQVESGYNRGKEYLGNILEKGAGFFNSLSSDKNERIHNFIDATFQKFNNSSFGGYRSNNGGQVYVKEYKRHDGTIVRAHWRDWPGTFDPNKKLSHMEQEELNHALDFWMDDEKYA